MKSLRDSVSLCEITILTLVGYHGGFGETVLPFQTFKRPIFFEKASIVMQKYFPEKQVTHSPYNKILTNINVWSRDGKKIVYDVRSDKDGSVFDGTRIETVNVETGKTSVLFQASHGACCGVATCSPADDRIVFLHGPEHPVPDWDYGTSRRYGVLLPAEETSNGLQKTSKNPEKTEPVVLDACQLAPPFVPGALRGGSHVHVFSGDGAWIAFTYQDQLLQQLDQQCLSSPRQSDNRGAMPGFPGENHDPDQRNVGVCVPLHKVSVNRNHPRNHDGAYFSVLVTRTVAVPKPGSDEIMKAYEDGWVGTNGYLKPDGRRQKKAIAFLGDLLTSHGAKLTELFLVDLPEHAADLQWEGDGPLSGTETRRPLPPKNVVQKRLTFTESRRFPGIQGPRHWVRSSPDGSRIAFLFRDDRGIVQIGSVSPNGGGIGGDAGDDIVPLTDNPWSVESCFCWHPDGTSIAYLMDRSVFITTVEKNAGAYQKLVQGCHSYQGATNGSEKTSDQLLINTKKSGIGQTIGQTVRLTQRSEEASDSPLPLAIVFSPDGKKIAFERNIFGENGLRFNQIFVVNIENLKETVCL